MAQENLIKFKLLQWSKAEVPQPAMWALTNEHCQGSWLPLTQHMLTFHTSVPLTLPFPLPLPLPFPYSAAKTTNLHLSHLFIPFLEGLRFPRSAAPLETLLWRTCMDPSHFLHLQDSRLTEPEGIDTMKLSTLVTRAKTYILQALKKTSQHSNICTTQVHS